MTKQEKPVAVTKEEGRQIVVLHRCDTVSEAELFIERMSKTDPVGVDSGLYGIDAPEEMVNPSRS
jgi:type IV secretory pathway protease TraF